jgi:hypothetical protein
MTKRETEVRLSEPVSTQRSLNKRNLLNAPMDTILNVSSF